jgi:hypothetical protein
MSHVTLFAKFQKLRVGVGVSMGVTQHREATQRRACARMVRRVNSTRHRVSVHATRRDGVLEALLVQVGPIEHRRGHGTAPRDGATKGRRGCDLTPRVDLKAMGACQPKRKSPWKAIYKATRPFEAEQAKTAGVIDRPTRPATRCEKRHWSPRRPSWKHCALAGPEGNRHGRRSTQRRGLLRPEGRARQVLSITLQDNPGRPKDKSVQQGH